MDMKIRPLLAEEQKYTYGQSSQLTSQTGMIGYLQGDFDRDDDGFYSTWFDESERRKTDVFKTELDEVINVLRFDRQYGPVLAGRKEMRDYVRSQSDSAFEGNCTTEYGFRVDTADYAYLLRCNPQKGDYNFYCYCYEAKWLDRHLQNARKGIRFITPDYKEKFRIPDGDRVRITMSDGETRDLTCRFIDECHVEVGSGLYHICEFAEIMERNGSSVIPLRSSLPAQCYSTLAGTGEVILVKKGESGYYKTDLDMGDKAKNRALVEEYNQKLGVTKAQESAMQAGSMFGWHTPAADPNSYDEAGRLLKSKQKDRGDSR